MADATRSIEAGRRAYEAAEWGTAFDRLSSARRELTVDDLALLARCAWLLSRVPETLELSEELFHRYRAEDRTADASMTALLLALIWVTRGEPSVGSGWLSRARRLLADVPESPPHGYLAYLDAMIALHFGGAPDDGIRRLRELTERFRDPALEAFEITASGLADLRSGQTDRGFARLDEAMLPVIAGQIPMEWAGDIYCTVIHVCHELADFQRMSDWTSATERWCAQFASEGIYGGICRVHRLELRPDPDLKWNEARGHHDYGQIDWDEFWAVVNGDGPCNKERLATRVKAWDDGAWVREAALAHARKQQARTMKEAA